MNDSSILHNQTSRKTNLQTKYQFLLGTLETFFEL